MTTNEAVALAWVKRYLRSHVCAHCGLQYITGESVHMVWHKCAPVRSSRRRVQLPEVATDRESARTALFHALVDAEGPSSIWRPIDAEDEP